MRRSSGRYRRPRRGPQRLVQWAQRLAALVLVGAIVVWFVAKGRRVRLPSQSEIVKSLFQAPEQRDYQPEERPEFEFEFAEITYYGQPLASYELSGLVVSHNNTGSITDAYHTSASVDTKDLCVVWDENVRSDIYQRVRFWSEPWTCFYQTPSRKESVEFNGRQLSNNHLLTDDPQILEVLATVTVGDQIHLTGDLVEYGTASPRRRHRVSSLVRTDTGNGACETIFLHSLRILHRSNPQWHWWYRLSGGALIPLALIWVGLFVHCTYREAYG